MLYEVVQPDSQLHDRQYIENFNPATGQVIAKIPINGSQEVIDAVKHARNAQREWAKLPFDERAKFIFAARRLLVENKQQMVETIVSETGKPAIEALMEIAYICNLVGHYGKKGEKYLTERKIPLGLFQNKKGVVSYHPYGVLGVISPWNFPLILSFGDALTALLAGNAAVIKPSEYSPLTARLMLSFVHRAGVPAELVQIVNGVAETAGALIDEVDIISFTGSVATGKKVMERASKTLTPVLLELGGKDPMIVCRDADLERAAKGAVFGSHFNTGQVCISVETCYVEAPVYDRFVALVLEESRHLRVGQESLTGEAIDMGPMMSLRQLEIVEKQVQDAVERGAKVLLGGKRIVDKDGYFFEPTVLTDVTPDMDIMQQETFGPVLPVVRVEDADEAMRLSNTSDFGLGSSVWTRDKNKGMELARQMEAGSTCVNDVIVNYLMPELPMGAIKQSGFGQRHGGADGIRMFCRVHSILVDRIGLKRELYWFPYSRRIEKLLAKGIDLLFKR